MRVTPQNLCEACDYKLSYIHKLLTNAGVSNHNLLTKEDLIKLYLSLDFATNKRLSLVNCLESLLKDDLKGLTI